MLKEVVESVLNEGTQATFIVKDGDAYRVSLLQYDGYPDYVAPILKKKFNSDKGAKKLTQKSGEIRSISSDGKVDYYNDYPPLLLVTTNDQEAIDLANNFANYKYFWDGKEWRYKDGYLKSFKDFIKL